MVRYCLRGATRIRVRFRQVRLLHLLIVLVSTFLHCQTPFSCIYTFYKQILLNKRKRRDEEYLHIHVHINVEQPTDMQAE